MTSEDAREQVSRPLRECDYCGAGFTPARPWARFCCADHRRAFERIVTRIAGRLAPEIRAGLRELLRARQ